MEKIAKVLSGDYTERDMLLAQAEHCQMCAEREVALGDDLGLADELFDEAADLRRQAELN